MSTPMYMIGNAHLDPVWLWLWREGYHEVLATFRSALDRLNETPDFVFTCACACYYEWVEENDPLMFEEIRQRVAEGRWGIVGGMWIQPDMNLPSGESILRQTLFAQRFFHQKFGKIATVGYNVDTFGHNAMTPQLLRLSGMSSYVWMRPSVIENGNIPEGPMIWEGTDGSRVTAYRIYGEYTTAHHMPEKIENVRSLEERIRKPVMCFYGVGNHGGGPTIENLRQIAEYRQTHGSLLPYGTPMDYFHLLEKEKVALPVWKGELQHHASGCYSTHSASKLLHRKAENAMLRMEKLGVLSHCLTGHQLQKAFTDQAWKTLLFNEFHDIMGGCCLAEALEEAQQQLCEVLSIADREENAALQCISWRIDTMKGHPERIRSKEEDWSLWGIRGQGTPVIVFNPHAFETTDTILIHRPVQAVRDDDGGLVPAQVIRASRTNGEHDRWDSIFRARVPALGYRVYWLFMEKSSPVSSPLNASLDRLENEQLLAQFNPKTGALFRLIHKKTGCSVLSGASSTKLIDIEHCDTWAHGVFCFDQEAGKFECTEIKLEEAGPVRAVLRVTSRHNQSILCQRYILYADADQLEVETTLDLHEKHKLVKQCYPTDFRQNFAEVPYGVIERAPNGDEEAHQRWTAVQGVSGGLAVLNNGKYSYSVSNGELRVTLANTSIFADHFGQAYRDDHCEYMDQGRQQFRLTLVPYAGRWEDALLTQRAEALHQPLPHIVETYHSGPLPTLFEGIRLSSPGIAVRTFKRSENNQGMILRAAESTGQTQNVSISLPLLGRHLMRKWKPFEIKTFFLPDDSALAEWEIPSTELMEEGNP